ncbi:MAG: ATP-binding protein [Planctomycetota bacterium]|nr:MAG: ATP-binding protein [Planctomycetota bacterium]
MTEPTASWHEENQRQLLAELARVRALLCRHAQGAGGAADVPVAAPAAPEACPALDALCAAFALSAFERDVLLLCAGPELDAGFAAVCARPSFSLALSALPDAHWSALAPGAPLRRWRLVEPQSGSSLLTAPLRIDERVLHHLTGVQYLDVRLAGLLEPVPADAGLAPAQLAAAELLAEHWRLPAGAGRRALQLCGDDDATRRAVAARAAAGVGARQYALQAADVPQSPEEREALARLLERESIFSASTFLAEVGSVEGTALRPLLALCLNTQAPLVVSSREPVAGLAHLRRVELRRLSPDEQRELWQRQLGPSAGALNGQLDRIVWQFTLSAPAIAAAAQETAHPAGGGLWEACRRRARPRLDDLAQRIQPSGGWEQLVLPPAQLDVLAQLAAQVRQRSVVHGHWGFDGAGGRGLGISALFAGPSGTGKTLAAEVLAHELDLDLYRIDLSSVVSKYIGETEKNLRRVFDAAEEGGAVLLFDEADALFGRRSEVKDSHDRYANVEISYLLQRMESYHGLAILTTNMKQALDAAFLRRLRFLVHFPFPDAPLREEIWRRSFPKAAPRHELDFHRLARLNVAGGSIRNIALNAAFLAAEAGESVGMQHVMRAAAAEYQKLEKPLSEMEAGGVTWSR